MVLRELYNRFIIYNERFVFNFFLNSAYYITFFQKLKFFNDQMKPLFNMHLTIYDKVSL